MMIMEAEAIESIGLKTMMMEAEAMLLLLLLLWLVKDTVSHK